MLLITKQRLRDNLYKVTQLEVTETRYPLTSGSYDRALVHHVNSPQACLPPLSTFLKDLPFLTCHSWFCLSWTLADQGNRTKHVSLPCCTRPDILLDQPSQTLSKKNGFMPDWAEKHLSSSQALWGLKKYSGTWIRVFILKNLVRIKSLTPTAADLEVDS